MVARCFSAGVIQVCLWWSSVYGRHLFFVQTVSQKLRF
jgi:hypothetical protein